MINAADIAAARALYERVAVLLVTEVQGSTPQEAGAAMLLHAGGSVGTIGGGRAEHEALMVARALLDAGKGQKMLDIALNADSDQCCGGRMHIAVAVISHSVPSGDVALWPGGPVLRDGPARRQVFVYGAGHVGRALVQSLSALPFRTTWCDARPGLMEPSSGVHTRETPLPEAVVAEAEDDAFHVVLTHSHALDLEIVSAVLARDYGYCGLIGSQSKRAVFARRLAERGVQSEGLSCPMGLPGLRDKRPAVIAVSVAADLLARDRASRTST